MDETNPTEKSTSAKSRRDAPPPLSPAAVDVAPPAPQPVDERDGKRTPAEWAAQTGRLQARFGKSQFTTIINGSAVLTSPFSSEHRAAAVLSKWKQTPDVLLSREEYETAIKEAKNHGANAPTES